MRGKLTNPLEKLVGCRFSSLDEIKKKIELYTERKVKSIIESESDRPKDTDNMIDFEYEEWDIHTIFYLRDNGNKYYITEV